MKIRRAPAKFQYIQSLRGLAAALVVLDHILSSLIKYGTIPKLYQEIFWQFGNIGVGIFFVISGFIMTVATADQFGKPHEIWNFFKKRLVRIVPIYWIATVAVCIFLNITRQSFTFESLFKSILFIPNLSQNSDFTSPLLSQGWTLNFEMFFYGAFALTIPWRMTKALLILSVTFSAIYMSQYFLHGPKSIINFYSNSLIFLFIFGTWLGFARLRWPTIKGPSHPFGWVGLAVIGDLVTYIVSQSFFPIPNVLLFIPQIFTVAVCAFSTNTPNQIFEKFAEKLGDASYSTYLFHTFFLAILNRIMNLKSLFHEIAYFILAFIGCHLIGLACNRVLERPLTRLLLRLT